MKQSLLDQWKSQVVALVPTEVAADALGITRQRLHQLMVAGLIDTVMIGKHRYTTIKSLDNRLKERARD